MHVVAAAGCDAETARALARAAARALAAARASPLIVVEGIGRDGGGAAARPPCRRSRPFTHAGAAALPHAVRRAAAGIRAVLGARAAGGAGAGRGRAIARTAASRLRLRQRGDAARRGPDPAAPGQRPHRARHRRERHRQGPRRARDPRRLAARRGMFLPYNCTSATRELADSQLFGHRRGSFTGASPISPA